ncbi:MAG: ketopantoate reductase family protein [Eubacterium sp.]|nr:ketopantoate reductase family protein [Eubacterium sp.]
MKLLIFGAGVIGSLYAALLSEAGHDVSLYARGKRLKSLQERGLCYRKSGKIVKADVRVQPVLDTYGRYDFILLAVRENQLSAALEELKGCSSGTIVTMVNALDSYDRWEAICGTGRILPAFPGAGGGFDGDVLDAGLTPRIIQPTTIGRTDGREKTLAAVFRKAKIPCQIVEDMHAWQICHLAMVVPIADAYYESADPKNAGKDPALMKKTAFRIRRNLLLIADTGMKLVPVKMHLFRILPVPVLAAVLGIVFRSSFGYRFMYQHAVKAPDEMQRLHGKLYDYIRRPS